MAKRKPVRGRYWVTSNRPMLHEVDMVFGPIDTFIERLATGEVECDAKGRIFFRDPRGEAYEAIPAVRGFLSVWQRLNDRYDLGMDFEQATKLCNRLEAHMPIQFNEVVSLRNLIDQCRKHYMKMDVLEVKSVVNTELIAIELQQGAS